MFKIPEKKNDRKYFEIISFYFTNKVGEGGKLSFKGTLFNDSRKI